MNARSARNRLPGLVLAGGVLAIFAGGLAQGLDSWHEVIVVGGTALQVVAVLYVTKSVWLGPLRRVLAQGFDRLQRLRPRDRQLKLTSTARVHHEARGGAVPGDDESAGFRLTQEEAILAGAMAILGALLTLAGDLWV
jgi:hypothetical protein